MAEKRPTEDRIDMPAAPRFWELATLLRAPRRHAMTDVDIGLFGVPIDFSGFRAGVREGPAAVREASRMIRGFNPTTRIRPFDLARIYDLGDAPTHPYDLQRSVDMATEFVAEVRSNGVRPLAVGGGHVITLPMLRGLYDGTPLGLIHFDAHADVYQDIYGSKLNNGTMLVRAHEEKIIDPKRIIQIGLRGTMNTECDWQYSLDNGFTVVSMDQYEDMGRAAVIELIKEVVGTGPVYLTFDIDALDPSVAPGTSGREPGGLFMRDVQMILRSLGGIDVIGGDVNEVLPFLDPSEITALAAANILFEMACIMVSDRVAA